MPDTKTTPRPDRGEEWTAAEVERLADADAEEMRRDPAEPRAYVRRDNKFLAELLEAEVESL